MEPSRWSCVYIIKHTNSTMAAPRQPDARLHRSFSAPYLSVAAEPAAPCNQQVKRLSRP